MADDDADIPIVDAHQHFWNLDSGDYPWLEPDETIPFRYGDYSALKRNYLYDDYRRDSANHNVVKTVHMEAEWNPAHPLAETAWLSEIAARHDLPTALVAQARLDRNDVEDVLAGHAACPLVRGIRQKPKVAASPADYSPNMPGTMADVRFREGYALLAEHGFSYDLQTVYWHLHEAAELAGDFPETQIVINHTGLPADRSEAGLKGWREAIRIASDAANVAIKISGIGQAGMPWTVDANKGIVLDVIAAFGTDRCMFASNFPVDGLCADFNTIFNGFKTITAGFSTGDRRKLFHDNAVRIYRL